MACRTASSVSRAAARARSHPSAMIPRTSSGFSSNSCARFEIADTSSTIFSISGALHSRQPIPALRQPACTQACVSAFEYTLCRSHTGHLSGSPGSVRRTRAGQSVRVSLLLKLLAQGAVHGGVARTQALDGFLGLLFELRLAAVDVIEAPGHLAGDLHVCNLVLAHRHVLGAVKQYVRGLQQGVAQKTVRAQIAVGELRLLILVGRDALQPSQGCDHRQQQMQFRMLRHLRLNEQRGDAGIEARRQPVDGHRPDVLLELRGILITRGERMPIGDEEKAFVLVLQFDPILESAVVVAQMQLARGPHAGQHASVLYRTAHACDPNKALMIRPTIRKAGLNSHPKSPNTDSASAMKG